MFSFHGSGEIITTQNVIKYITKYLLTAQTFFKVRPRQHLLFFFKNKTRIEYYCQKRKPSLLGCRGESGRGLLYITLTGPAAVAPS